MGRMTESNHNITFDCKYHVVFCPKYRRKVLVNGVDARLKELLNGKARELRTDIVEMEVMPDHVHLRIQCDPQFGIHRVVKQLKGYTSHVLRQEFPILKRRLPSLWTNSYFVATVGAVQLDVVKRYIEDQKGH
jgi:putative transposase